MKITSTTTPSPVQKPPVKTEVARPVLDQVQLGWDVGRQLVGRPCAWLLGSAACTAATAVVATLTPAAAVVGFLGGAVKGAMRPGPAARWGATAGSAVLAAAGGALGALASAVTLLIPPLGLRMVPLATRAGMRGGATVGRFLGMGLGSVVGGLPSGVKRGLQSARAVATALPRVARPGWRLGHLAGSLAGGAVGGALGAVTGLVLGAARRGQGGPG